MSETALGTPGSDSASEEDRASRELRGVNNWEKTAHVGAHL